MVVHHDEGFDHGVGLRVSCPAALILSLNCAALNGGCAELQTASTVD